MIRFLVYTLAALLVIGIGTTVLLVDTADPNQPPMTTAVPPPAWVKAVERVELMRDYTCAVVYRGQIYKVKGITSLDNSLTAKSGTSHACYIWSAEAECIWRYTKSGAFARHDRRKKVIADKIECKKDNPAYYEYIAKRQGKVKF